MRAAGPISFNNRQANVGGCSHTHPNKPFAQAGSADRMNNNTNNHDNSNNVANALSHNPAEQEIQQILHNARTSFMYTSCQPINKISENSTVRDSSLNLILVKIFILQVV